MRKYETFIKLNNKYHFIGWYPKRSHGVKLLDIYCRDVKDKEYIDGKFVPVIKTYLYEKWEKQDGTIEYVKYGSYVEEV